MTKQSSAKQSKAKQSKANHSGEKQSPNRAGKPTAAKQYPGASLASWIGGARLRTLPLAVSPVIVGAALAGMVRSYSPLLTALALAVSVLLQIGVNYSNDYSDGVRGTDDYRVGPARLTGSGLVNPKHVLAAALSCFGLAALAGLAAVLFSQQWWFLALGLVAIVAAWFYTGGKRPYGYNALGEVMVFIFFGPVATCGTYWLQSQIPLQEMWWFGSAIGLFAVAVLIANNIRDIENDKLAGKKTLSVLIGARASKVLFTIAMLVPFAFAVLHLPFYLLMVLVLLDLLIVLPTILIIWTAKTARELILVLQLSSAASLVYAILLAFALVGVVWA